MLMPRWFLIVNGAALLLLGGALVALRLRQQGPWWTAGRLFGVTWALLCLCMGGVLLAMASGAIDQPGRRPEERRARPRIEFPVDR